MPLYAIARIAKQKGGNVAASGHHNDRTRETLNADPSRKDENQLLVGDERNVRELVTEVIDAHGGKPRSDSVEAVEMMLTATHSYFTDERGEIEQEKVDRFVERAQTFLEDPRSGGVCVKAVLHMDEQTPHVQAHKVPIDPNGKLNCKHYFGGREKLSEWQDLYHEYMGPLGLERGERGSQATHTEIKEFYGAITKDYQLRINFELLPDPPLFRTKKAIKKYKKDFVTAISEQIREPLKTLRHQALLTREETSKREATEILAAERVTIAETNAERAIQKLGGETQENGSLRLKNLQQGRVIERLKEEVRIERGVASEKTLLAEQIGERLQDIPLPDVMERLGYGREQIGESFVYRNEEQEITLVISDQQMFDEDQELICRNSIDCVVHMRNVHEGEDIRPREALYWLADNFGEKRATAASLVRSEQYALEAFNERRQEIERERGEQTMDRTFTQGRGQATGQTHESLQIDDAREQDLTMEL